jgi:DNA replication and repair protein RecF
MLIHTLRTSNFRNLVPGALAFSTGGNFISGRNGQGKTNLLEAIHWLIALRGKRGTAQEAIRTGGDSFHLEGELTFGDLRHAVGLTVQDRAKKLLIDGTAPRRKRDYLQDVLVVDFFPEDMLILLMEPGPRRRFIDITSAQYSLPHEDVLRRFKRILDQRNSLLKTPGGPDIRVLESYDEPLADAASKIVAMRLEILAKLAKLTDALFREGIGEKYEASLHYIPSTPGIPTTVSDTAPPDPEPFRDLYLNMFFRTRGKDIDSGRTTVGPHRDDWGMTLDGKPVRSFASRGEVRSAMFALHIARFHVLAEKRGIKPVVLIDDVMSELDSHRRARVIELLPPGQVFLTACDPIPDFTRFGEQEMAFFEMSGGVAKRVE